MVSSTASQQSGSAQMKPSTCSDADDTSDTQATSDTGKLASKACSGCLGGKTGRIGLVSDSWADAPLGVNTVLIEEVKQCDQYQGSLVCFSSLLNTCLYSGANLFVHSSTDKLLVRSASGRVASSLDVNGSWSVSRNPLLSRRAEGRCPTEGSTQSQAHGAENLKDISAWTVAQAYAEGGPMDVLARLRHLVTREQLPSGCMCNVPGVCDCRRSSSAIAHEGVCASIDQRSQQATQARPPSSPEGLIPNYMSSQDALNAVAIGLPDDSALRRILVESPPQYLDKELFSTMLGVILHGDTVPPVAGAIAGYDGPVQVIVKNANLGKRDDSVVELQHMCGFADDHFSTTVWEVNVLAALLMHAHSADLWRSLGCGIGTLLPALLDCQPAFAQAWKGVGGLVGDWISFHYQWRAGGADVSAQTHDYILFQELRHSIAVRGIEVSVTHRSSWADCDYMIACLNRGFDTGVLLHRQDIFDWAPTQRAALWIAWAAGIWHDAVDYGRDMVNCEQQNVVWVALSRYGEDASDVLLSMFTTVVACCSEVCEASDVYLVALWFMITHSGICRRYNGWRVVQETYPQACESKDKPFKALAENMCREIARDFNLDTDSIWYEVVRLSDNQDELRRLWFGDHCSWSGPNAYASAEESAALYALLARDCLTQEGYCRVAGHLVGQAMCVRPEALLRACIEA
ncbi:unnamed protein product [Mortierella alpina]